MFILTFVFIACQDGFEEVDDFGEDTLMAGSWTVYLVKKATSHNGSFDNVVDGSSCFAINFPYTVQVGDIEILVTTKEDLGLVEDTIDRLGLDDDNDVLEIFFPITITMGDYTEIEIETQQQLTEMDQECDKDSYEEGINCIGFVYPLTIFTFDMDSQQRGIATLNSDRELRRFFDVLEDDDLVSIGFPITMKKRDGVEKIINTNTELTGFLEDARDDCEEDEDIF